jgi:anti-sigma factor RsiW
VGTTTWRRLNRRRDHRWARRRISDYLDGDLPRRQRDRLAHHEELCPDCARLIATLDVLLTILPSLRLPPAASFEVAERTAERVRAQIAEWT